MLTILLTLIFGITLGLLLATITILYLFKIKCPKCKQLRPVKEIVFVQLKTKTITGQACQPCQRPKPQVSIEL